MKIRTLATLTGLAALLAVGTSSSAFATIYDFSYTFVDSGLYAKSGQSLPVDTITGSFTGTGALDDITVSSVVSMSLGSTPLAGPFTFSHFVASPGGNTSGTFASGATVSDTGANNFLFVNSATGGYFYVIQPWYNPGQTIATQYSNGAGQYIDVYNGQYVAANFSVSAVPEASTWAMMLLGFAGIGFAGFRQHRSARTA